MIVTTPTTWQRFTRRTQAEAWAQKHPDAEVLTEAEAAQHLDESGAPLYPPDRPRRKMGRPRAGEQSRSRTVGVAVTEDELARIDAESGSRSDYVHRVLLEFWGR